jgi:hypothetical protein
VIVAARRARAAGRSDIVGAHHVRFAPLGETAPEAYRDVMRFLAPSWQDRPPVSLPRRAGLHKTSSL